MNKLTAINDHLKLQGLVLDQKQAHLRHVYSWPPEVSLARPVWRLRWPSTELTCSGRYFYACAVVSISEVLKLDLSCEYLDEAIDLRNVVPTTFTFSIMSFQPTF
jgi:hypothetical protein